MALGAQAIANTPSNEAEVFFGEPATLIVPGEEEDQPIDPMVWRDEKRMKEELVAWAKAVASIVRNSMLEHHTVW